MGLQAGPVQTRRMPVWAWGWLEAFRFFRWCPDGMLPILNNDLVWAWKLVMRCQFGFGGGSRPFVSLDAMLPWLDASNVEQRSCLGLEACDENSGSETGRLPLCCPKWSNFCYCAVGQEKAVFKRKRAISGPSALLGPEMVKFGPNFCCCAADQEKAVFKRKRPFLAHLPFWCPKS